MPTFQTNILPPSSRLNCRFRNKLGKFELGNRKIIALFKVPMNRKLKISTCE
jgi:hypothetical protein